jgi:hypothetical protein
MPAPTNTRPPELELSDSEPIRSLGESLELLCAVLAGLERTLGIEPPRPQLRLVRGGQARALL